MGRCKNNLHWLWRKWEREKIECNLHL